MKPTKGPFTVESMTELEEDFEWAVANGDTECAATAVAHFHTEADANLFSEAVTVFHETGLTPRQILEQRDELRSALAVIVERIEYYSALPEDQRPCIERWEYTEGSTDMANARKAIQNTTPEPQPY